MKGKLPPSHNRQHNQNLLIMEKKTKKLQLNKETVAVLNSEKMSRVRGGAAMFCGYDAECPEGMMCAEGMCMESGWDTWTIIMPTHRTNTCLTCNPGHQDSCGLCTTKYMC